MTKSNLSLLFFLSVFSIFSICSDSNKFTKKENIEAKKEVIRKDHEFGKKIDRSILVSGSLICGFCAFKILQYMTKGKSKKKSKILGNKTLTKKVLELEKKCDPKLFSQAWTKKLGMTIFSGVISVLANKIFVNKLEKLYRRYHCFDNLEDFINVRLNDTVALQDFVYNAGSFENGELRKDLFVVSLRNLVSLIEYIIAFMEYKIDSIRNVSLSEEEIRIPSNLFDCLNDYCSKAQAILEGQSDQSLFAISNKFVKEISSFVVTFKGFENRIAWLGFA